MALPPGPRRPKLLQFYRWLQHPLPFLDECARRYGDIFTLRFPVLGDYVLVSSPALIKQVFTADPEVLQAGVANRVFEPIVGPSSIFPLDGAQHLRQRRLLLPAFHGERMHAYAEVMRDVTEASLRRWPIGQPFSVHDSMQSITLDVILRTVFGLEEGAQMRQLAELLVEWLRPPPAAIYFLSLVQRSERGLPFGPYHAFLRLRERIDRILHTIIAERRKAAGVERRHDILSLMLAARDEDGNPMTDGELRDELVTMIIAGHATTATSLAWAFERILANVHVRDRLHAEVTSVVGDGPLDPATLNQLEYTDAVIKETLRARPIAPIVVRHVQKDYAVGGYVLPAGSKLAPCIYLAHRRPDVYADPERFMPERFIGAKIDPYQWLPFGGGIRRCLGMAFALFEAKIVLATVMARVRLSLASVAPLRPVRRGILLAPEGGTRLVVDARSTSVAPTAAGVGAGPRVLLED